MRVEGVPEGYDILRLGKPKKGDICIALNGTLHEWKTDADLHYTILRKLPEPLRIREGAWYERRDGKIVGPCKKRPDEDSELYTHNAGGLAYRFNGRLDHVNDYPQDLIREVPAPKPAIDPGEGWRLVNRGEKIQKGDEWQVPQGWQENSCVGYEYCIANPLRRRIAPKYRPFRNAEEFMPHRDKWIHQKTGERGLITSYSDLSVWHNGTKATWQELFDNYCFDEDGTPCGVKE